MPMIDVYAPKDLLPAGADRKVGEELTKAVLRAEGVVGPRRGYLENTAAFIHRMEPSALQTAAQPLARAVRVQIITPPGALARNNWLKTRRPSSQTPAATHRRLNVRGFSLQRQPREAGAWRVRHSGGVRLPLSRQARKSEARQ